MYEKNNCVFHYELPRSYQYMRNWNKGYLEWAQRTRLTRYAEPIKIHIYSEVLQKFRLAAQGKTATASSRRSICASASKPISIRCRSITNRWKRSSPTSTSIRSTP